MRYRALLEALVLMLVTACGGKDEASSPKEREAPVKAAAPTEPAAAERSAPEEAPGRVAEVLTARGIPAAQAGEGDAKPIDITINLKENQRASGVFRVADRALDLYGFRQDGRLRLWIAGKVGDDDPRRGYLVGTIDGNTAAGSFALSGNGGEPNLQGTWASVDESH
jgi:hypothetical protein